MKITITILLLAKISLQTINDHPMGKRFKIARYLTMYIRQFGRALFIQKQKYAQGASA